MIHCHPWLASITSSMDHPIIIYHKLVRNEFWCVQKHKLLSTCSLLVKTKNLDHTRTCQTVKLYMNKLSWSMQEKWGYYAHHMCSSSISRLSWVVQRSRIILLWLVETMRCTVQRKLLSLIPSMFVSLSGQHSNKEGNLILNFALKKEDWITPHWYP